MALDLGFDLKTFLERTCRSCSRYFDETGGDEMLFHRIFNDISTSDMEERKTEINETQISDDVKEVFEEFRIWKLNIRPIDGLPQQICHDCLDRFRGIKRFRKECLDTQKVLKSYFKDLDMFFESASQGRLSPKSESSKSEPRSSPNSFINEFDQRNPGSPQRLQQFLTFSSPKLRLSPKFAESTYAETSIGTPPPLFEEIKTEMEIESVDYFRTDIADVAIDIKPKIELKDEIKEEIFKPLRKSPSLPKHFSSSDDESSTPTSDEDDNDDDDNDDGSSTAAESEPESVNYDTQHVKPLKVIKYDTRTPIQCTICSAAFAKRSLLKEHHSRAHPQEKPYVCNICSSAFKSNFLLTQHKHRHNRPDSIKCELCSKYFRSLLHLQRHEKNFHLTSTYTCHICHEKFENYTQIRFQYHVRQHGEKRFHCQFCEKSFHQKIHLANHERTHTKQQAFCCDICGISYRHRNSLEDHMLSHGSQHFHCDICGQNFLQKSRFQLHRSKCHKQLTSPAVSGGVGSGGAGDGHICRQCNATFKRRAHLDAHIEEHHLEKRTHTCGYCNKIFAKEASLKAHIKTHAQSLKNMRCTYCELSFENRKLLLLHENQKHGTQHFQCNYCDEIFQYGAVLTQHLQTHLDSEVCDEDDLIDYNFETQI